MTLMIEVKSKLDTVLHQQQIIMKELCRSKIKPTPRVPEGILIPAGSHEQLISIDQKLRSCSINRQSLVSFDLTVLVMR